MSTLDIRNATISFGDRDVWRGLELTANAGDMVAITGKSGGGKSTLLNTIAGILRLDEGSIRCGDVNVTRLRGKSLHQFRKQLGYLFQNYGLVQDASVADNVALGLGPWPWTKKKHRNTIDDALETVGLSGRGEESVAHLSGGEQQCVALARILVRKPTLLLADEPTGALDVDNSAMVLDELRHFANRGTIVIIATHDRAVVDRCDKEVNVATFEPGDPLR